MIAERGGDIVEFEADFFCFDYQLLELGFQQVSPLRGGGGSAFGHYGSYAGADFDQALGDQMRNHFMGGVGIDFQGFAKSAD